jgi:hypothetical protein
VSLASDVFQRELTAARQRLRGDIFRGTASWACEDAKCAVNVVRIGFVEERGLSKPLQLPLRCPRCMAPLTRYIGLEVGR